MTDFETFMHDYADGRIFRYYRYKEIFTPYEQENKFSDESIYENGGYANFCYIRQAIELPDGDILLKLEHTHDPEDNVLYEDDEEQPVMYVYEKLSNIKLEEYAEDNIGIDE
jgi:hypothetical protein